MADALADALAYLSGARVPDDRMGVIGFGFGFGGAFALWAATTAPVTAAVTFAGGGITTPIWSDVPAGVELAGRIRAPWLGLYGDQDPETSVADVEVLRSALGSAGVAATIKRYPDAGSGFADVPGSENYRAEAGDDAWARALGWFDAHLR